MHAANTHHLSGTNGIAERVLRRVKEATATTMAQSGVPEDCAMNCDCYLWNLHDKVADGRDSIQEHIWCIL